MIIRGIKASEQFNEFYPKVVFRENGAKELLASGEPVLSGDDFVVESVKEGFFNNGYRYDIDTKTFSLHPYPENKYDAVVEVIGSAHLQRTPIVVYKDCIVKFPPYNRIQVQPLIDTVSPW